ncbi:MAG: hypothetical protein CMJ18_06330 [Phycisphaeraceae bacterium]|nr:hypothetical protein [Phycisphaeraceae bacterium]
MAKRQGPEGFAKRQRERQKQQKRQEKAARKSDKGPKKEGTGFQDISIDEALGEGDEEETDEQDPDAQP